MLSTILLATPLGTLVGYNLAYYMIEYYDWQQAMILQAIVLVPLAFVILIMPTRYVNFNLAIQEKQKSKK